MEDRKTAMGNIMKNTDKNENAGRIQDSINKENAGHGHDSVNRNQDSAGRNYQNKDGNRKNIKNYQNGKNGSKDYKNKRPKQSFAHKGMLYQHMEGGLIHDWNCPEIKNVNLAEYNELKEIPILTGSICPKCGKGLLLKKYTDDKEEGRALSRFFGDCGLPTEFLCELYEVYHIYPYVYEGALKLTYKDRNWKIQKADNQYVIFHNEFGENMPGWFNDYWKEEQKADSLEAAIKIILAK